MKTKYFNKPILLIIYNRPNSTQKVFSVIQRIKPSRLFIVADGPKREVYGDFKKCNLTRNITENITWNCKVKRLYRDANLGSKYGIVDAINWFFENVKEGIILEDDCLPSKSFFYFCEQMLSRYKENKNIMHISGNNFQNDENETNNSYYFSKYFNCWGWATWKRAWQKFDPEISDWPLIRKKSMFDYIFDSGLEKNYWYSIYDLVYKKIYPDVWDYQWQYTCWKNMALSIVPSVNLVENIGFGSDATHTTKDVLKLHKNNKEMKFPLLMIEDVIRDIRKDKNDTKNLFGMNIFTILYLKKLLFLRNLKTN